MDDTKKISAQKITTFFVAKNKTDSNEPLSEYIKRKIELKTQPCQEEPKEVHANGIEELSRELTAERQKNEKLVNDLKKSSVIVKQACAINLSKDVQIENLTQQLKNAKLNLPSKNMHTEAIEMNPTLFNEFGNFFNSNELKQLRSVPSGKSRDSTFVLKCMRFLYTDLAVSANRSVTGRSFKGQKKQAMSPWKSTLIKKMLGQRLDTEDELDGITILVRLNNVHKLMRHAISKLQPKTPVVNKCPNCLPDE